MKRVGKAKSRQEAKNEIWSSGNRSRKYSHKLPESPLHLHLTDHAHASVAEHPGYRIHCLPCVGPSPIAADARDDARGRYVVRRLLARRLVRSATFLHYPFATRCTLFGRHLLIFQSQPWLCTPFPVVNIRVVSPLPLWK